MLVALSVDGWNKWMAYMFALRGVTAFYVAQRRISLHDPG